MRRCRRTCARSAQGQKLRRRRHALHGRGRSLVPRGGDERFICAVRPSTAAATGSPSASTASRRATVMLDRRDAGYTLGFRAAVGANRAKSVTIHPQR